MRLFKIQIMTAQEHLEDYKRRNKLSNGDVWEQRELLDLMEEYAKSEAKSFALWLTMPRKDTNKTVHQLYKEYRNLYNS